MVSAVGGAENGEPREHKAYTLRRSCPQVQYAGEETRADYLCDRVYKHSSK